jgi:hypothetical protein
VAPTITGMITHISCSIFILSLCINSCTFVSFLLIFVKYFCPQVSSHIIIILLWT